MACVEDEHRDDGMKEEDVVQSLDTKKETKAGQRRKAREAALQALFEIDFVKHDLDQTLQWLSEEFGLPTESESFVRDLVKGVVENRESLDETIRRFAPAWPIEDIASVDRNILRLGVYEIWLKKVPAKVAINEAVELAKVFGADNSAKFVNGVLGSVYAHAQKNEAT